MTIKYMSTLELQDYNIEARRWPSSLRQALGSLESLSKQKQNSTRPGTVEAEDQEFKEVILGYMEYQVSLTYMSLCRQECPFFCLFGFWVLFLFLFLKQKQNK